VPLVDLEIELVPAIELILAIELVLAKLLVIAILLVVAIVFLYWVLVVPECWDLVAPGLRAVYSSHPTLASHHRWRCPRIDA